jgi:hypothetical protein
VPGACTPERDATSWRQQQHAAAVAAALLPLHLQLQGCRYCRLLLCRTLHVRGWHARALLQQTRMHPVVLRCC